MSKDKQEKGGKNAAKELKKALFYQKEHGCKRMSESELKKCDKFSEKYKAFLDAAKTEREANAYAIALLEKHGFLIYELLTPAKIQRTVIDPAGADIGAFEHVRYCPAVRKL